MKCFLLSYVSLYILVCLNSIASVYCFHSFSLGPKMKAIKLRFDFSFGLVYLSQVFQVDFSLEIELVLSQISVLKLSQESGFSLSKLLTP